MPPTIADLSEEAKVVPYALGAVRALIDRGYVVGGGLRATVKGLALFDQLKASGYRPPDAEVRSALREIGFTGGDLDAAAELVRMYGEGDFE